MGALAATRRIRVAIIRATRARIRQDQGDLLGALEDITFAIEWAGRQTPVDERSVAIWRATRAGIRRLQGDSKGACLDVTSSIGWAERQTRPPQDLLLRWHVIREGAC